MPSLMVLPKASLKSLKRLIAASPSSSSCVLHSCIRNQVYEIHQCGLPPRLKTKTGLSRAQLHPPASAFEFMFGVWGLGSGVWGPGFRFQGSGFRLQGSGFRVQGSWCEGLGSTSSSSSSSSFFSSFPSASAFSASSSSWARLFLMSEVTL